MLNAKWGSFKGAPASKRGCFCECMKKAGDVAHTCIETDRLLENGKYDLVILDVSLPDGLGFDICQKIRQTSKVPIMFLTAMDEEIEIACVVSEGAVSKIYNLADGNLISDNREENSVVNGSYWVFRLAAYGFLAIISLITVLNIMNSISMGVSARIKQYGAMRAVGMESRQVTKMITAEAVTYAVCGTIVGILIGLWFHYLIYVKIIITHFGGSWNIPVITELYFYK